MLAVPELRKAAVLGLLKYSCSVYLPKPYVKDIRHMGTGR